MRLAKEGDGTVMIDHVWFDASLGALVESVVPRRYVAKVIGERNGYLKSQAERTARG
jgi:hypothetical protein